MYTGLRKMLFGEKTIEGKLVDILGEKELNKEIGKLDSTKKYIFVYDRMDGKGDYQTFEKCHFDSGEIHLSNRIIYFKEPKISWEGAPIKKLIDIIPIDSIQEETKKIEEMAIFTFQKNMDYVQIVHNNPIEAFASNVKQKYNRLQGGLWEISLSKIEKIVPGMSFYFEDIIGGSP